MKSSAAVAETPRSSSSPTTATHPLHNRWPQGVSIGRKLSARHLAQVPRWLVSGYRSSSARATATSRDAPRAVNAATRSDTVSSISSAKHVTGNSPVTHAASRRFATASVANLARRGFRSDSSCEGSAQSASRRPRRRKLTSSLYDLACARVNDRGVTSRTSGGRRMSDLSVRMVDRRSNAPRRAAASARDASASRAADASRIVAAAAAAPSNASSLSFSFPTRVAPLRSVDFPPVRAPPFAFPPFPRGADSRGF